MSIAHAPRYKTPPDLCGDRRRRLVPGCGGTAEPAAAMDIEAAQGAGGCTGRATARTQQGSDGQPHAAWRSAAANGAPLPPVLRGDERRAAVDPRPQSQEDRPRRRADLALHPSPQHPDEPLSVAERDRAGDRLAHAGRAVRRARYRRVRSDPNLPARARSGHRDDRDPRGPARPGLSQGIEERAGRQQHRRDQVADDARGLSPGQSYLGQAGAGG